MPTPATLEREATELRAKIREHEAAKAEKLAAAHKLREEETAKGFSLTDVSDEAKETFARIDAAFKEADVEADAAAELKARLHRLLDQAGGEAVATTGGDLAHPAVQRMVSIGALVTATDVYAKVAAGVGSAPERYSSEPMPALTKAQTKAFLKHGMGVFADAGDGTPLVPSDERLIPPVTIPKREVTLLDLITVASTGRDAVTWARQTARTVATPTTVAFGTPLNKSRYQYETVTSPVYRKGHYAVVDEGNIADQEEFQGIVDDELMSDLRLIVEADALGAAGGSDWTGIYNEGTIGDFDAALADNPADAIHKAITTVRIQLEAEPTAVGLNPEDFEDFYLAKGQDGHYLHHRGPIEGSVKQLWGLPASVSTAFTQPLVGDFRRGATLWVREGVSIVVGRIDDQLLEGLWTIRAQFRGAFAVKQPKAFCTVSNFES